MITTMILNIFFKTVFLKKEKKRERKKHDVLSTKKINYYVKTYADVRNKKKLENNFKKN